MNLGCRIRLVTHDFHNVQKVEMNKAKNKNIKRRYKLCTSYLKGALLHQVQQCKALWTPHALTGTDY